MLPEDERRSIPYSGPARAARGQRENRVSSGGVTGGQSSAHRRGQGATAGQRGGHFHSMAGGSMSIQPTGLHGAHRRKRPAHEDHPPPTGPARGRGGDGNAGTCDPWGLQGNCPAQAGSRRTAPSQRPDAGGPRWAARKQAGRPGVEENPFGRQCDSGSEPRAKHRPKKP